ncbi:MAG: hypothetical protein MTP17_03545 [Candidatus Midichloria sp.]|nr:MAG: hypothetical protein MTP17_03545 [Candidatus Midichloria sp.]
MSHELVDINERKDIIYAHNIPDTSLVEVDIIPYKDTIYDDLRHYDRLKFLFEEEIVRDT